MLMKSLETLPKSRPVLAAILSAVVLSACSEREAILSGTRIGLLPEPTVEAVAPDAAGESAGLAVEVTLNAAPMVGLGAGHAGGNPSLQAPLDRAWTASIGGKGTDLTELAVPVVGDGKVFTVAPNGMVSAFDVKSGGTVWSASIEQVEDEPLPGIGGGLALSAEGLVVHAGGQTLALLNPDDGSILWSVTSPIPLRGGPTIIGADRFAVTDLDGNMRVSTLVSAEPLWEHFGIAANTVLFGSPAPAYGDDSIVLAGVGGEVSYFDASLGDLIWTDSVASLSPRTPIQGLGDVSAHPVHDGGMIFVVSQSGRFVAFSARTGLPVWERAIAGLEMPWVSGETVFAVSVNGRVYAMRREDGAVRWIAELPDAQPVNAVVTENPPRYFGPVVAGGRVYVVSKSGMVHAFNADTGVEVESFSAGFEVLTPPQLATGRMFLVGRNGTLLALE